MKQKWFHSRILVFSVISALILMTSAPAFSMNEAEKGGENKGPVVKVRYPGKGFTAAQEKNFTLLMEDGKRLLKEWMDYAAAIDKFKEAEKLATQNRQKSEVYYYLSLAYFASLEEQGTKDFTDTIQKLIEVDYYRQLDENECPPQYVAMYNDIKRDFGVLKVLSVPPGADVFFNDGKVSEGKTPLTVGYKAGDIKVRVKKGGKQKKDQLTVLAGQETSSPVYSLEGRSSLIYIIGGALVAGAAGAVLLLAGGEEEVVSTTGSLTINSSPSSAQIYMGKITAEDTSQVTPYTFTDIAPGSYTIVLKLGDYADHTETAVVTAGQTTTVNPSLTQHTIAVTKPAAGDKVALVDKTTIEIKWTLDGGTQALAVQRAQIPTDFASLNREFALRSRIRARAQNPASATRNTRSAKRNILSREALVAHAKNITFPARTQTAGSSGWDQGPGRLNPGNRMPGRQDGGAAALKAQGETDSAFISNFKIFLLSGSDFKTRTEIVSDIQGNQRKYTWKVHKSGIDLTAGQYMFEVQSQSDPNVTGSSGAFDTFEPQIEYQNPTLIDLGKYNLDDPYGLTVGNGSIYVSARGYRISEEDFGGKHWILKLTMNGQTLQKSVVVPDAKPYQIAIDKNGFVYVAEEGKRRIAQYTRDLVPTGKVWKGAGGANLSPRGVAVDADLNVYINSYGSAVLKFGPSGNLIKTITTTTGKPMNIIVDDAIKMLYIADRGNDALLSFTTAGNLHKNWKIFASDSDPSGIDIDSKGNIFVCTQGEGTQQVSIIGRNGNLKGTIGFPGFDKNAFKHPVAVSLDDKDAVYVLDNHPSVMQIKKWVLKK